MKIILTTNNTIINYNHVVSIELVDDADFSVINALIPVFDQTEEIPHTNITLATGTIDKMKAIYKELVKFLGNEVKLLDFTKLDKKYDDAGVSKTKGAKHELTTFKPS